MTIIEVVQRYRLYLATQLAKYSFHQLSIQILDAKCDSIAMHKEHLIIIFRTDDLVLENL